MKAVVFFIVLAVVIEIIVTIFKGKPKQKTDNRYKRSKVETDSFKSNRYEFDRKATTSKPNSKPEYWDLELLKSLEWKRYEEVCKEYLRLKHCDASMTCIGADGGIDIRINNSENKTVALAQCKAYSNAIKVNMVRELYGVMAHEKVRTGIFLTTSTFTNDAKEFAKEKQLLLIDGNEMIKLIKEMEPEKQKTILNMATEGDYTTPTCARCDTKMVLRKGQKGDFWGCKNFPRCRSTLQVRGG